VSPLPDDDRDLTAQQPSAPCEKRVRQGIGLAAYAGGRFPEAGALFRDISLSDEFVELTIPAYKSIT
jgi:hypothetical protein